MRSEESGVSGQWAVGSSWTTAYRRPWGFGGFWEVFGGLITFLAARLSRYSLGLAAMLCTLLLQRTLPHAINFFL